MFPSREYSQLYRLIDDSLRPYTESDVVSLTKDKEKDLLLVLSQETVVKPACTSECSSGSNPQSEDDSRLANIIADFVILLTVQSRYVQHLAGKVLVVISEFMAASGSNWDSFIHLLCVCLEVAISNTLSYSSSPSTMGAEESNCDLSSSVIVLKPRLKNANWFTVAGIIQALRNILKYLKQEYDDQLVEAYLYSVSSSISNLPWDLLNEIYVGQNGDAQKISCADALRLRNVWCLQSRNAFLGNLVQFFCSLVEQSVLVEAVGGSTDKHQILCKISNLVPKLLSWCLSKLKDCSNTRISQYFRHKLLVLMIRLSSQNRLECSILVSWLQLLHKYFQDLLWRTHSSS
ncbi:hypothetical protein L1049_024915 [Liquidambar formosana]|uniref:Uncharacterized protein n=1 Tax=Liquidambar formosana TaxID=63359 RepID=A0AAP0X1L5_LIQFO